MAPKKVNKGKGAAAEPTQEEGWNTSKCSQSDLETLVSAGLLFPRSVIQWRPALGKDHLYENTGEIVAFTSHLEWGLGFPCSSSWEPSGNQRIASRAYNGGNPRVKVGSKGKQEL